MRQNEGDEGEPVTVLQKRYLGFAYLKEAGIKVWKWVQLLFWKPWKGCLVTGFILFLVRFDVCIYTFLEGYFNVLVGFCIRKEEC